MRTVPTVFGTLPNGSEIQEFTLDNHRGVVVKILTYGGIIRELWTKDRNGELGDIVLGFSNLKDYVQRNPYFGTLTGRVANRIAHGRFSLDGVDYRLATNNGPHHLHGGVGGFDKVLWSVQRYDQDADSAILELSYESKDGEEGYPGSLQVHVTYALNANNEFSITYHAGTNKSTPVNLTSHSYFNLRGYGDIKEHYLKLYADQYTPVDATLIPTGEIASVQRTAFDFTTPVQIGVALHSIDGGGFDHNFVLRKRSNELAPVAEVYDPSSGRKMEIFSTEPGVQFYTGNFLDGTLVGKNGALYVKHSGFCLETQHFPDAVNHPHFPSVILKPGENFHSITMHKFSTEAEGGAR